MDLANSNKKTGDLIPQFIRVRVRTLLNFLIKFKLDLIKKGTILVNKENLCTLLC